MIRDFYLANVESSQGANQFIKFSQHISDNWLPSLLSSDSLALKLIFLLFIVIGTILLNVPSLKEKIGNHVGMVRLTTVGLALMFLAVPLGWDYFPTISLTIIGIWVIIFLILTFARFSLKIKENWVWAALVYGTIITAILNLSQPIPTLLNIRGNNNPVDKYFLVVCTAFLLFIVLAFFHSWEKHYEFKKSKSFSEKLLLRREKLVSWALFSWCAAILLYFIGIYWSGTQRSVLTSLIRPAVSASKIFILADNPTEATLAMRRSGLFMGLLSLVRLSGFLVSA